MECNEKIKSDIHYNFLFDFDIKKENRKTYDNFCKFIDDMTDEEYIKYLKEKEKAEVYRILYF